MPRRLFFAALCVFALSASASAFVDYDPFNYSGTTLNGQSGGSGWLGPWIATGTAPTIQLSDDNTSLSYPATFQSPLVAPTPAGDRVLHSGDALNNASSSRLLSQTTNMGVAG